MSVRFIIALALFNMTSVRTGRVLLTLYAIKLGAEPVFIGMLAAGFSVIPVCLSWAAGRWSDRFGARWLLLVGVGGSAAGMLLPYFAPGLPAVLMAGVLSGLSMSFCNVCLQNLVGILSTPENRPRNFSNYALANSLSAFTGPLIAGFSIDHAGLATACLVVVALAAVPLAMLALRGSALPRGRRQARAAGGLWHAVTAPGVRRVLAISSVGQTGTDLFQFYMPVYAHEAGLSASAIGVVLAAYAAAAFVVRYLLPNLISRLGEERVLRYAFALSGISVLLVPFFKSAAVLALISLLIGLSLGLMGPITMMLMFSQSAEGRSGEALGLRQTADNLTRLTGPLLFGMVASAAGLAVVFWLNAAMLGSGSLLARRRALRRAPEKS
jgi:predicted MFS family arabinose efflux permease